MAKAASAYLLGGMCLASTFTVTLLNGVCYATFKHISLSVSSIESAIVTLSAISCIALIVLVLLWVMDIRNGTASPWKGWRAITYGVAIAYLSLATGVTAGAIAWSAVQFMSETKKTHLTSKQRSLMVARCVVWAFSVLNQGVLGGYLLMSMTKRERFSRWPSSFSVELDVIPDQPSVRPNSPSKTPSLIITETQRESMDRKTSTDPLAPTQPSSSSAASNRYSGRTLFQRDSKHNSIDSNPSLVSYPESAVTRSRYDLPQDNRDSCAVVGEDHGGLHKLHRSNSEVKRSLDSLILRSSLVTSVQLETPKGAAPKLSLPDESNIHPLFRTHSPNPPPTVTPGTILVASPAAGQIISVKTLNRVRSTNSLQNHTPRSRSPLFEQAEHPREGRSTHARDIGLAIPSFIMGADVRRSITRYEKKYDLHESPHES